MSLSARIVLLGVALALLPVAAEGVQGSPLTQQATATRFRPTTVSIGLVGSSALITVTAEGLPAGVDGVQINLQHDRDLFKVNGPSCVGAFDGASVAGPTDVSGGTVMGCFFVGQNVKATSGDVIAFTLSTVKSFSTTQTVTFGAAGSLSTQYTDGGVSIGPGVTDALTVRAGVAVSGKTTLQYRLSTLGLVQVRLTCPAAAFDQNATANAAGDWQIALAPPGACNVSASAPGYLGSGLGITVAEVDLNMPPNTLPGGDVNGDGLIDVKDLVAVGANFGKSGPVGWGASS